jgi:hypothetical protein
VDGIEILTGALVVLTGYYAWQTRRMVGEMERARQASLLPKLGVHLDFRGPNYAELAITNVGLGPAFDVNVELCCVPVPRADVREDARTWRTNLLVPGEKQRFRPPDDLRIDEFAERYKSVTVSGTMRDALRHAHQIDEALPDLRDTWGRLRDTGALWAEDPTEKATRALEKPLNGLQAELSAIREVATGEHARRLKALKRRRRKRKWLGRTQRVRSKWLRR